VLIDQRVQAGALSGEGISRTVKAAVRAGFNARRYSAESLCAGVRQQANVAAQAEGMR
jgi:hypothetical protein